MKVHSKIKLSVIFAILTLVAVSCSKKAQYSEPGSDTALLRLFNEITSNSQKFSINLGGPQQIIGENGTIITFKQNSFLDQSGYYLLSGQVDIYLIEMYKPSMMVRNNVTTTTTNHKLLRSGGSVWIKAFHNGKELKAGTFSIAFKQDNASSQPMALYYGKQTPLPNMTGTVQWIDEPTDETQETVKLETQQGINNYYLFNNCTSFDWINCDYFYNAPEPKTDIKVNMPDASFNNTNTQVFLVFPELNMVSILAAYNSSAISFNLGYSGLHIPVGSQIKLCILSAKGEDYYLQVIDNLSVTADMEVNYTPIQHSLSNISNALADL